MSVIILKKIAHVAKYVIIPKTNVNVVRIVKNPKMNVNVRGSVAFAKKLMVYVNANRHKQVTEQAYLPTL